MCVFTLPDNFDRRCPDYEDDISAEEETESKSSWLQSQNENCRR